MRSQAIIDGFYKAVGAVLRFLGLQNIIFVEAEHDARENAQAVFQEMLRRGWNRKYRILLISEDPEPLLKLSADHVKVVKRPQYGSGMIEMMRVRWLRLRSRLIIDENKQFKKCDPYTKHVYLSHGSPIKNTHDYYNCKPDTDYALCQSEFWRPIESYSLKLPSERFIIKGMPRNDALFSTAVSMDELYGDEYKKVAVWYPTFRQRVNHSCIQNTDSAAIPILHDEESALKINEIAARYGVLLVVKPHPVQDLSLIKEMDLDHIKVVTNDFFLARGVSPYAFLGNTDALITDYSSVVFDYLLTGKPIALAQEDYEEYEKKVGFVVNMDLLRGCSTMLNCAEDFDAFFRDLVSGNDPLREKRDALMRLTNRYTDGNSTQRVVDWLETLL